MKFRIVEEKIGNQEPRYYVEKKNWLGFWKRIYYFSDLDDYGIDGAELISHFDSVEDANAFIYRNYTKVTIPIKTKIIKEITIID